MDDRTLRTGFLCLALAFLSSCMFEPANETDLASTRESVTFRGVSIFPESEITIDASPRAGGLFTTITTTTADPVGFVWGGATLYEWTATTSVPIDRWQANCSGQETFVRARGGALILTTYDSTNLAMEEGEVCIQDAIDSGIPFVFAARICASPAATNVRLTAPGSAPAPVNVTGDLEITSHLHADDWSCLESVDGDFIVSDPYPEDIAFPSLAAVTGDMTLMYGYEGVASRTIDMPSLTTVGGSVDLAFVDTGDPGLGFMTADFGLDSLSSIGSDLTLFTDTVGTTAVGVSGLDSLLLIPGNLAIQANFGDNTMSGFAPNLAEIQGDAIVDLGFTVNGGFNGVIEVGGDLDVRINSWSLGNGGFDNLTTVGGNFFSAGGFMYPDDYPSLQTVAGDFTLESFLPAAMGSNHFPLIASIGGVLTFRDMDANIANFGSTTVQVGGIALDGNTGLGNLPSTLSVIELDLAGPATFVDNSGITDCDAQDWVDAIAGYMGVVTIMDNDAC